MTVSEERAVFYACCLRVGAAAAAAGASLRKVPGKVPALQIERSGRSVTFPIVTDDRAWRDTTVEEALYAILVDARGWSRARLDDASISALDPETQREAPLIKRDFASEMERVNELVEVLGGDGQLQALYAAAGV